MALASGCASDPAPLTDVPKPVEQQTTTTEAATTTAAATLSSECSVAFRAAAAVTDPAAADPLIIKTLSACETVDEWYAGLVENPAAFGLTDSAEIGLNDMEVRNACYGNEDAPVCADATEQGRI